MYAVRCGGGIGDLRVAAEGVRAGGCPGGGPPQEGTLTGLACSGLYSWWLAGLGVVLKPANGLCVARKPDWPDRLLLPCFFAGRNPVRATLEGQTHPFPYYLYRIHEDCSPL